MKRTTVWIVMSCLAIGLWTSVAPAADEKAAPAAAAAVEKAAPPKILAVGDKVPDFNLTDGITGAPVSFEKDYLGKAKLTAISFMNTACSACSAEIRFLSQLAGKHPDFRVIAMAVDSRGAAAVKSYNENNKFNATYVLDPEYTQPPKYGFNYTPALVMVDKSGKIVLLKGGFNPMQDPDSLTKFVESNVK